MQSTPIYSRVSFLENSPERKNLQDNNSYPTFTPLQQYNQNTSFASPSPLGTSNNAQEASRSIFSSMGRDSAELSLSPEKVSQFNSSSCLINEEALKKVGRLIHSDPSQRFYLLSQNELNSIECSSSPALKKLQKEIPILSEKDLLDMKREKIRDNQKLPDLAVVVLPKNEIDLVDNTTELIDLINAADQYQDEIVELSEKCDSITSPLDTMDSEQKEAYMRIEEARTNLQAKLYQEQNDFYEKKLLPIVLQIAPKEVETLAIYFEENPDTFFNFWKETANMLSTDRVEFLLEESKEALFRKNIDDKKASFPLFTNLIQCLKDSQLISGKTYKDFYNYLFKYPEYFKVLEKNLSEEPNPLEALKDEINLRFEIEDAIHQIKTLPISRGPYAQIINKIVSALHNHSFQYDQTMLKKIKGFYNVLKISPLDQSTLLNHLSKRQFRLPALFSSELNRSLDQIEEIYSQTAVSLALNECAKENKFKLGTITRYKEFIHKNKSYPEALLKISEESKRPLKEIIAEDLKRSEDVILI